jgi:two-component system response regulator HydG
MITPEQNLGRVLVVDDRVEMAETVADALIDADLEAIAVGSSVRAIALLREEYFDVLVTDLRMPELDGLELLTRSIAEVPERPVIVMTAYGAIDTAIESIRRGAFHYLTKPFKNEELVLFVRRALEQTSLRRETERLRRALRERSVLDAIVGRSEAMREVLETARRIAGADTPALILGETGTGKGLLARTIHEASRRAAGPFVTINCAAIPEPLLESELFGHVRGAFTGATESRAGLFVEAQGGTLFLDEIGDMPAALQAKLLHVLEGGVVRPVGGAQERAIDVRVLAATHRDLHERARAGTFRADLLYRIDVVSIDLPALRHRREDIPYLVEHFFEVARGKHASTPARRIGPEAQRALMTYAWPGNVRELAHLIERVVLLSRAETIELADLPPPVRAPSEGEGGEGVGFSELMPMRELQRRYAAYVLERMGGSRGKTAERLGIDPKTLWRLLGETDSREGGTGRAATDAGPAEAGAGGGPRGSP